MDVSLHDLQVVKNTRPVLRISQLRFPSGSTTAVLGPNGSGKTTLLRSIAGLEQPVAGEVRLGGVELGQEPAARRLVGIAFQSPVFVRGSVRYNLDLALRLRHLPEADRRDRIEEATRECAVVHLLERSARRLSAGESQRVSLARALALRAPVTLLDEPLTAVDRITRTQLLGELPRLLAKFATTTIVATHDREEAFRLADRLVILVRGEVKAAGSKTTVYSHPPDRATAELLGYTVLPVADRLIAIPPGGLQPGEGTTPLLLEVRQVAHMGDHLQVSGLVGKDPVDLRLPVGIGLPEHGSSLPVHAEEFITLE